MKALVITLIFLLPLMAFQDKSTMEEYTFVLTITSVDEGEHPFSVVITSIIGSEAEPVKIMLENQVTPFERKLESGQHTVVVNQFNDKGLVESKIQGVLNGRMKGYSMSDNKVTTLKAGPGGNYSAGM